MKWPTWYHAAILAAVCVVVWWVLGRLRPTRIRTIKLTAAIRPAAQELAIIASLYAIWRIARKLPLATAEGAIDRARQIDDFQRALHFPSELSLQHFVLDHELARPGDEHVLRHRACAGHDRVPRLAVRPPSRPLPALAQRDRDRHGLLPRDPFRARRPAALPARTSATSTWQPDTGCRCTARSAPGCPTSSRRCRRSTSPGRRSCRSASSPRARASGDGCSRLQVILTMLAVSATGNHWWLDGIVAIALLGVALAIDTYVRRYVTKRRQPPEATADTLGSVSRGESAGTRVSARPERRGVTTAATRRAAARSDSARATRARRGCGERRQHIRRCRRSRRAP